MRLTARPLLGLFLNIFVLLAAYVFPTSALALTHHQANAPSGQPVFILNIHDVGETPGAPDAPSTHTLSDKEKQHLTNAASHWAERLSGLGSQLPVFIDVTTNDEKNAAATSFPSQDPNYTTALQQGLMQDNSKKTLAFVNIGIGIGGIGWIQDAAPSSLPLNGQQSDLFITMVHEVGHALGISSSAFSEQAFHTTNFNLWDKHLYDHRGVQAAPGMVTVIPGGTVTDDSFDLSTDKMPYFIGAHVAQVLDGASIKVIDTNGALTGQEVNGIPINGVEGNAAELSHMELKNGLMSHQTYSNYATFMELELAALQDIGYTIDRKNFYGLSIYGNDLNIDNTQGYFLRNADGNAYVQGQYNTASYGTGLHIYGSGNTVNQKADLLSAGLAGTGIRVDGENNRATIAPGTRVHANGSYGTGLLVAYGKAHNILHQGEIAAMGEHGIGARFDFGSANNGDKLAYRGSYIHTEQNQKVALLPELEGALVQNFSVAGALSGSQAAIYISENALVNNIDVLRGAQISGNIISHWDKNNPLLQYAGDAADLVTQLSFGRATGSDGMGTASADSLFNMRYDGTIYGPKGMNMQLAGGQLVFNGNADVLSVSTATGSILSGNAHYKVSEGFSNNGILAPGNSIGTIRIEGDYTQASSGQLQIEFDGAGHTDQLLVSGASTVDGILSLNALPSFYAGTLNFSQDVFLQVQGASTGSFSSTNFTMPASPTLSMNLNTNAGGYVINTQRAPQAYSRYARTSTAAPVGEALRVLADDAQGDMQNLLANLDFSALDGSTVGRALPKLSPAVYASVAQASINTGHLLSNLLTDRMLATVRSKSLANAEKSNSPQDWTAFVSPYGASTHQNAYGSQLAYTSSDVGLLGGLERSFDHGLLLGAHVAFNAGRLDARDGIDAKNTNKSLYAGVHGLYNPQEWGGAYAYGLLRGGVENNRMQRAVAFDAYSRSNTMEWTGLSAGAVLGGGYDWQWGQWNVGPTVNVEYTMVHRPDLSESEGYATRLHVQSAETQSLRTAAGASLGWNTNLGEKSSVQAQLSALWLHELLDDTQKTEAFFADYGTYQFTTKTRLPSRDSMALQAGLSLHVNESTRINAQVGTEFFRPGYNTIQGNISVNWEF